MGQNLRSNRVLIFLILLGSAIGALFPGIFMLTGQIDAPWWTPFTLVLCGLIGSFSVIPLYRSSKKQMKISDEQSETIHLQKSSGNTEKNKVHVLTSWLYSVSEWKEFLRWEKRKSTGTIILEAVILVLSTASGIHYLKNEDWAMAIIISLVVGVIYILTRYLIYFFSIHLNENKMPEVTITNEAIIVNGRAHQFCGKNVWLGKVTVNDAGSFNVLEITYWWPTAKGRSFNEIRVPIPKGSLKEAIFLQEKLMDEKRTMGEKN